MANAKTWALRAAVVAFGLGVPVGGLCTVFRDSLSAKLAVHRFHTHTDSAARVAQAVQLLELGEAGIPKFVALWSGADAKDAADLSLAWSEWAAAAPPADRTDSVCEAMLDRIPQMSDAGKAELLNRLETLLAAPGDVMAERCRVLVTFGFAAAPESKAVAVRWASHPKIGLRKEAAALLHDPSAEVRLHVVMAVAHATDDRAAVVTPEELFPMLHDADADVRNACTTALRTHGLTLTQVSLARQLTHPDAAERLLLLNDMADANLVTDPGPWLERMSKDADPAVRLGAARTAAELNVKSASWMAELAANDPDPLVRRWSAYYRDRSPSLRTAGR